MTDRTILTVLHGSHAHGLARDGSDLDIAEFFITPTVELLRVPRSQRPKEGYHIQTAGLDLRRNEVGAFIEHVIRSSHINDAELAFAPNWGEQEHPKLGLQLRDIIKSLLRPEKIVHTTKGVIDTMMSHLDDPKARRSIVRFAEAAYVYLDTGVYPVVASETVKEAEHWTAEHAAEYGVAQMKYLDILRENTPTVSYQSAINRANDWLMGVRREFWE